MTKTKVLKACRKYREVLTNHGYFAEKNSSNQLDHISWMLTKIPEYMDTNTEKAMRWVGFVQGVLYARDLMSVEEMKSDTQ